MLRHDVPDGMARPQIVDDRRAGRLQQKRFREKRGDEIAGNEVPGAVDEEAAISVAIPGDADISLLGNDAVNECRGGSPR